MKEHPGLFQRIMLTRFARASLTVQALSKSWLVPQLIYLGNSRTTAGMDYYMDTKKSSTNRDCHSKHTGILIVGLTGQQRETWGCVFLHRYRNTLLTFMPVMFFQSGSHGKCQIPVKSCHYASALLLIQHQGHKSLCAEGKLSVSRIT